MSDALMLTQSEISAWYREESLLGPRDEIRIAKPGKVPPVGKRPSRRRLEHGNNRYLFQVGIALKDYEKSRTLSAVTDSVSRRLLANIVQKAVPAKRIIIVREGVRVAANSLTPLAAVVRDCRIDRTRRPDLSDSANYTDPADDWDVSGWEDSLETEDFSDAPDWFDPSNPPHKHFWAQPGFRPNLINEDWLTTYCTELLRERRELIPLERTLLRHMRDEMYQHPQCFVPVDEQEEGLPAWAHKRLAAGEPLFRWDNQRAEGPLHALRRYLDGVKFVQGMAGDRHSSFPQLRIQAQRLIRRLPHQQTEDFIDAAGMIQEQYEALTQPSDDEVLFPAQIIDLGGGFMAERVNSVQMLSDLGSEARNCLEYGNDHHDEHAEALRDGMCEYWALREEDEGHPILRAVVSVLRRDEETCSISEIQGPGNENIPQTLDRKIVMLLKALDVNQPSLELLRFGGSGLLFRDTTVSDTILRLHRVRHTVHCGGGYLVIRRHKPIVGGGINRRGGSAWFLLDPSRSLRTQELKTLEDVEGECDFSLKQADRVLRALGRLIDGELSPTLARFLALKPL